MANVIKHKRGSGSDPSASNLVIGELAIRTDNGKLFTKMDSGAIAEIAGGGSDIAINTLSSSSATGGGSATFNGSAYRFTLSSPPSVSAQQLLVSVNGVVQKPVAGTGQPSEGYSVDGSDIIFGDAPATGADFFILTFRSLGVSEPADNSVTNAKVASNAAIAGSKITPTFTTAISQSGGGSNTFATNIQINTIFPSLLLNDTDSENDFSIQNQNGLFAIRDEDAASNRLTISSAGVTTIAGNLDVGAGIDVTGNITSTGDITINESHPSIYFVDSDNNPDYQIGNINGEFQVKDTTNNVVRLQVATDGHVDVAGNLDVGAGIDVTGNITATGNINLLDNGTIFGGDDAANTLTLRSASGNVNHSKIDIGVNEGSDNGGLHFYTAGSTVATRRMTIKGTSGNVGIGTTDPGDNKVLVQLGDANNNGFRVKGGSGQGRTTFALQAGNTTSTASTSYRLMDSSGDTVASLFFANNTDDLQISTAKQGGEILFNTSTTANSSGSINRARFDMSGNFFLGKNSTDHNNTGVELMQNGSNAFTRNNGSVLVVNRGTNNGTLISLRRSNSEGGTISVTPTSAAFNSNSSDRSLKKNFENWTENTLDLFKNLNPQKFNYIIEEDGAEKTKGYIAQDLVDSFPEAYPKNDDDKYMFNPSGMVVYLMKALQEAVARIEALEAK